MRIANLLFAFLIGFIFLNCKGQEKTANTESINNECYYCNDLRNNYFIDYPHRQIDKNIEGIPLTKKNGNSSVRDSMLTLTAYEKKRIEENWFCFLGMNSKEIDAYFHPKYERSEWSSSKANEKILLYYFNLGQYMINRGSYFSPVEKPVIGKESQFWLIGGDSFKLNFTKNEKGHFIFTGTERDSINFKKCLNKK